MHGYDLIRIERIRQIHNEGYTEEDDKGHHAELMRAAQSYMGLALRMTHGAVSDPHDPPVLWPWEASYWHPTQDVRRNLVKAGALIAAAIDALPKEGR